MRLRSNRTRPQTATVHVHSHSSVPIAPMSKLSTISPTSNSGRGLIREVREVREVQPLPPGVPGSTVEFPASNPAFSDHDNLRLGPLRNHTITHRCVHPSSLRTPPRTAYAHAHAHAHAMSRIYGHWGHWEHCAESRCKRAIAGKSKGGHRLEI